MAVTSLSFSSICFSYRRSNPFSQSSPLIFDEFSWQVPQGATVILGPNGAGKTTLLSLGATALKPNSGKITLGDRDSANRHDVRAIRRGVGWLPQQFRPIPGLSAREQVAYAGWLKGMSRPDAWSDAHDALARVGLSEEADRPTHGLSGGQQRRVGIAQLLVHRAGLMLLDEPTSGLDPQQRAGFRKILRRIAQDVPVVVSTHQVDDLSDLFDTVVILDHGVIRFQGSVAAFMALAPPGSRHPGEAAYASLFAGNG